MGFQRLKSDLEADAPPVNTTRVTRACRPSDFLLRYQTAFNIRERAGGRKQRLMESSVMASSYRERFL